MLCSQASSKFVTFSTALLHPNADNCIFNSFVWPDPHNWLPALPILEWIWEPSNTRIGCRSDQNFVKLLKPKLLSNFLNQEKKPEVTNPFEIFFWRLRSKYVDELLMSILADTWTVRINLILGDQSHHMKESSLSTSPFFFSSTSRLFQTWGWGKVVLVNFTAQPWLVVYGLQTMTKRDVCNLCVSWFCVLPQSLCIGIV